MSGFLWSSFAFLISWTCFRLTSWRRCELAASNVTFLHFYLSRETIFINCVPPASTKHPSSGDVRGEFIWTHPPNAWDKVRCFSNLSSVASSLPLTMKPCTSADSISNRSSSRHLWTGFHLGSRRISSIRKEIVRGLCCLCIVTSSLLYLDITVSLTFLKSMSTAPYNRRFTGSKESFHGSISTLGLEEGGTLLSPFILSLAMWCLV